MKPRRFFLKNSKTQGEFPKDLFESALKHLHKAHVTSLQKLTIQPFLKPVEPYENPRIKAPAEPYEPS